ncbi:hypothetical protein PR202_ga09161 [Eleusine coracana subsp. coracana]|uniref:E3 ubiquitin-protein ligase RMA n=1 Tax=Eleusine coracana subsp. coracana TaxID=191504 RepID=A0AAV5C295_ELECO|nr:hypothetical protein QOZ80_1AG0038680 [Eleusine coracana subsp. coracana]GJM92670.1 hypothetical protein PR202_ga09161 [Eleusine coracana subsp. coracana]
MDADEARGSSRRMDLNLYLGLPRVPRPRRSDLGSDLSLGTPMPSSPSSSAASVDAPPPPEPLLPPYSPSRADLSPAPPEAYSPYNPEDPPAPDTHLPYMPPPERLIPDLHDGTRFAAFQHPPPLVRASELLAWDTWEDRPSSSTASSSFFPFPDSVARYRRLLEQTGSRWLRTRRFRSDLPPLNSEARPTGQDAAVLVPQRDPASNAAEVNKVTAVVAEFSATEESSGDQGKSAATFECNICFEMASEPVVTSCGHLFCWPCLYQWLNVYSSHKECPVCKGEVTEANITPSDGEKAVEDVKPPAVPTIPPRPHGNRLESFRQQFHHMRPISRRLGEARGILSSWRRLLDQQIMNSTSSIEGPSEAGQEINDNTQHTGRVSRLGTLASWMRARRLQREAESAAEGGSSGPDGVLPGNDTSEPPRQRGSTHLELLEHLAMIGIANTERLNAAMSDLRRIAPSQYGGSTSSSNPQNNEPTVAPTHVAGGPSADQASNSSTVAVIQGDPGISESAGEPSNAGSSRSLRRRTRSNTLGSLDVDGGDLQRNKRRRMN